EKQGPARTTQDTQETLGNQDSAPTPSAGPSPEGETTGPVAVGMVLNGRHRIVKVLASGAFSRVYRAEDILSPTSPPLAIKVVLDDPLRTRTRAHKRKAVRWFRREVAILLEIQHPSIPTVHAHWTETVNSGPF